MSSFVLQPLPPPASIELETPAVLRQLTRTHRALTELKGAVSVIPNENTLEKVRGIQALMQETKQRLRNEQPKLYSQHLLNNLFRHPYTKIEFIERDSGVSQPTASKYLGSLEKAGFVRKQKVGRTVFHVNAPLFRLLGD